MKIPSHSRIIEEMYETAQSMHKSELIDKRRMNEYDALYESCQVPLYSSKTIKDLRTRLNVSQSVLALILNTSVAAVRSWEIGAKKPGGPSSKLLYLLDKRGLEALL